MRVSKGELIYVLKQAFEGCGYDFGACENMASQVVWAEMHELGGLKILDRLITNGINPPTLNWDIHTLDGAEIRFSVDDNSVLYACDLGVSLATAKCKEAGLSKLVFERARDAVFLFKYLVEIAANGRAGLIYQYGQDNQEIEHWARCNKGAGQPSLGSGWLDEQTIEQAGQNIVLVVGDDEVEIDGFISTSSLHLAPQVDDSRLSASYQNSLISGIEVSDKVWRCLNKIGAKVLVEATEASRKGAGA